jgi:carboxypeptidase C (cathepsin A)
LGSGGTDFGYRPGKFATNAEELASAMNRNDRMYALVATGYYDLIMSPAQARYATEHAGIPKERLTLVNYEAGHEPYVDGPSGVIVTNAIRDLIRKASR